MYHKKTKLKGERLVKRITDALIRVDGGKYHFECESKNDGQILLRITEYDMQIALSDADYLNHNVSVELPETAVVYLRRHRNLPDSGTITYKTKYDITTQKVPYLKMREYSLENIEEKHLYILMPFYLMRYEHALKNKTSKKELQKRMILLKVRLPECMIYLQGHIITDFFQGKNTRIY